MCGKTFIPIILMPKNHTIRLLIYNNFNPKWLNYNINNQIFNEVYIHLHSEYDVNESLIINNIKNNDVRNHLSTLLFEQNSTANDTNTVKECINRLKKNYIKNEIEELRNNLKNIDYESDKLQEIINTISNLEKDMNEKI